MRCRVGDLAVVVKSGFTENIGLIVSVIARGTCGDWVIRSAGSPMKCQHTDTLEIAYRQEADALDSNLRPIRGENGDDQERNPHTLPAVVEAPARVEKNLLE